MVKRIIAATAMLIGANCYAQNELVFNGGVGKQDAAIKFMSLSLLNTPFKSFPYIRLAASAGTLSMDEIVKGTGYFVSINPTIEAKTNLGLYLRASQGFGYISQLNRYLDSHMQFFTKVGGGLSTDKIDLGFFYQHISSGQATMHNFGINLIGIEFGVNL